MALVAHKEVETHNVDAEERFREYMLIARARPGPNEWSIEAYTLKDGQIHLRVGLAEFHAYLEEPDDGPFLVQTGLKGWNVDVDKDHRGKGLASEMYRYAERVFKMPIHPGDFQTPDGEGFLQHRHARAGIHVARRFLRSVFKQALHPTFPETEIGLMTEEEFLHFTNPGNKHHPPSAYDHSLADLNKDLALEGIGEVSHGTSRYVAIKFSAGIQILDEDQRLVAVIHDGVAYYDQPRMRNVLPHNVFDHGKDVELPYTTLKQVKYLSEVAPLVSPVARENETRFPVILHHIIVKGEALTVRAEKPPTKDAGVTMAILNAGALVVAEASDEWGATLIMVAQEYRSYGLGKLMLRYWWEVNPTFESGGYTPAGEQTALATWRERVHQFSANGWYMDLIKEGRLPVSKVKQIMTEANVHPPHEAKPEGPAAVKPTGDILIYSDGEITFVVYDRAFLEEQDDKFIHGFGFFRDAPHVGSLLYRIEYDRPFADLTTRVALQMAKDNGEKLYNGDGYHDMVEGLDRLPGVTIDGDYIVVTQDLYPVRAKAQQEKRLRKATDPYDEKFHLLLEQAESKWD